MKQGKYRLFAEVQDGENLRAQNQIDKNMTYYRRYIKKCGQVSLKPAPRLAQKNLSDVDIMLKS